MSNETKELMSIINYVNAEYGECLDYARHSSTFEDLDKLFKEGSELKDKIRRFITISRDFTQHRIFAYNQELERVGLTHSIDDGESITEYANYNTDSSICCRCDTDERAYEITGLSPFEEKEDLIEWLRTVHHKFALRGNRTCGSHLHVSFMNNSDYHAICSKDFFDSICNFMYVFGKMYKIRNEQFYKRLTGADTDAHYYAKTTYNNSDFEFMLKQTHRDNHYPSQRYHAINPVITYHGTVDIRAIPNFTNVETLINFDLALLAFIEAWVTEWYDELDEENEQQNADNLTMAHVYYKNIRKIDMHQYEKQTTSQKEIVF